MDSGAEQFQVVLVLPDGEQSLLVDREAHIWDFASTVGISLPALCHHGYCLTCAARLEEPGEMDQSDSLVYLPQDRQAGFVLLCTGKPRSNLRIRTHQQNQMREYRKQHGLPAPYSWNTGSALRD
jgi:ferredoxin